MKLKEFVQKINDELKVDNFQDYSPNGLQVEGRENVQKVAVAISASLETIEKAVRENVDALIVHHGLFWKGDPYQVVGVKKKKLSLLLNSNTSLLAYHLPLDAHPSFGNNWKAATEMGWFDLEPFGLYSGNMIGVKGKFKKKTSDEFEKELEAYYSHKAFSALGGKKEVESAALISGGAYKEISSAKEAGVDCFVTGNFDEPAWHLAFEEGINFFALGHAATERVGPIGIKSFIEEKLKIETIYIDDSNPF